MFMHPTRPRAHAPTLMMYHYDSRTAGERTEARRPGWLSPGGGMARVLPLLALLLLLSATARAQFTFDMGNSEIAVWSTGSGAVFSFSPAGLVFDADLRHTHKYRDGSGYTTAAVGIDGPWSYDAPAGDIVSVLDTIGCGWYNFTIDNISFRLNLTDAHWGAGDNNSVYKLLFITDGTNVKLRVRSPGASGSWSAELNVTSGASLSYWDVIRATHDPNYARNRTGLAGKVFHVDGDDNLLPLPSMGVQSALLDVNLHVRTDVEVPMEHELLINGFVLVPTSTTLRFDNQRGMTVRGGLRTVTTQYGNEQVLFTSSAPSPSRGDWRGVHCLEAAYVHLNRVGVSYAETGVFLEATPDMRSDDLVIVQSQFDGLRSEASGSAHYKLRVTASNENNIAVLQGSTFTVDDGVAALSTDMNGVFVGEGSNALLRNCLVYYNRMNGVYAFADARVVIDTCEVFGNGPLPGEDWVGVYTFYNNTPLVLRYSKVHEQSVGVGAIWGTVHGYLSATQPVQWYNRDSLGRNCIYWNDYNLLGHYGTFEFARAYYAGATPHYQGGENSIYDPQILQGTFEYSQAWLQRDYWDGNTLFNVMGSMVDTRDPLWTDMVGCMEDDTTGGGTDGALGGALLAQWNARLESMSVDSLPTYLYGARNALSAEEAATAIAVLLRRLDGRDALTLLDRVVGACAQPAVLCAAHGGRAVLLLREGDWSAAAQALDAQALSTAWASPIYLAARAMQAMALHSAGRTQEARASVDSLFSAHPGNRDIHLAWRSIGGGAASVPRRGTLATTPASFAVLDVHPHPVGEEALLRVSLHEDAELRVALFDLHGREVRVLAEGRYTRGVTTLRLQAGGLPSGVYHLRLSGSAGTIVHPITILHR